MMKVDDISIILGFIEGFGLIVSPCILPILPIFLAGSLMGSMKRPMGIIVGFSLFFALMVFFSYQLVHYFNIDFNVVRNLSDFILICLGVVMMSTFLTEKFSQLTQGFTKFGLIFSSNPTKEGGFLKGLFFGSLISIVWTPCAGPILAAVIVQSAVQKTTAMSFFTLLAFALGASIPMFIISLYGKSLIKTFSFFKLRATVFRRCLGGIIVLSVLYMVYFPGGISSQSVEENGIQTSTSLINGLWVTYPAPKIQGIETWFNSKPLQLNELLGQVILIDFWTYSCINCIRTLPYLKSWYSRYHDKGLVIIGIHTPEFDFEKNPSNVKAAILRYGILYPVALDNQFVTWRNFNNHFWPAHYLINKRGEVVYHHFGEGDYDITENNIRFLLGINQLEALRTAASEPFLSSETPETYLGYERSDKQLSPIVSKDLVITYHFPATLSLNAWGLEGRWLIHHDGIISEGVNDAIKIHFNARKVFVVMGNSTHQPIKVNVQLNGEPLGVNKGKDVQHSSFWVDKYSIFELVSAHQGMNGYLQLTATAPGIKIYTFTFGS